MQRGYTSAAIQKMTTMPTSKATLDESDVSAHKIAWVSSPSSAVVHPETSLPAGARNAENRNGERGVADGVVWQWLHRTGFRNYHAGACERIEQAYQAGAFFVRIKSGKLGNVPLELFFVDMIQHDPTTGNSRKIRRLGPDPMRARAQRRMKEVVRNLLETGRARRMVFDDYQKRRRELVAAVESENKALGRMKEDSIWTAIVRSDTFFVLTTLAVLFNSVWIAIDADNNKATTLLKAKPEFVIAENFFCVAFTTELVCRFCAFRDKCQFIQDGWFCFDLILVLLMVFETWLLPGILMIAGTDASSNGLKKLAILRVARIIRLTRLARITKLLRAVPEVMTLLKGILAALRSVFFTVILLVIFLYVFGVIFRVQGAPFVDPNDADYDKAFDDMFGSVALSMWTLLIKGTFLDGPSEPLDVISDVKSWTLSVLFVVFMFMSSCTILNMLIGILCDVVHQVREREQETAAIAYLQQTMLEILECYDKDGDRSIGKEEFSWLMQNPEIFIILQNFGVDANDLAKMQDILFDETWATDEGIRRSLRHDETEHLNDDSEGVGAIFGPRKLSFDRFLEKIMQLRGGNSSTVHDVVDLREYINTRLNAIEKKLPPALLPDEPDTPTGRPPPVKPARLAFEEAVMGKLSQLSNDQHALASKIESWQHEVSAKQNAFAGELTEVRQKLKQLGDFEFEHV